MNKQIEAMKQALEVLRDACILVENHTREGYEGEFDAAITALREALAEQPAQRDSSWCMKMNGCKTKCEDCPDEVPEHQATAQEPDPDELAIAYMSGLHEGKKRKPWVGLTDEQIAEIAAQGHQRWIEFARAIEAAHGIKGNT